jgi:hypothetical protein
MKPQVDFAPEHPCQDPNGSGDFGTIGVCSAAPAAKRAICALRVVPGFWDCPDDFHVGRSELDKAFWAAGVGVSGV